MLLEMTIRNLAVIEAIQPQFHEGFHVLTGETGAGKSIVIDALTLVAGGRSSADLVRYGADKASIEALFQLPEGHPVWAILESIGVESEAGEPLLIRRDITSLGKSTSRINGQMVNLTSLKAVGDCLINIHGQHEHQSLMRVEAHIDWLDLFGQATIGPVKAQYVEAFAAYGTAARELKELESSSKQALQMLDLYRFQVEELEAAELKPGEDEALAEEKKRLGSAEKLYASAAEAYEQLGGGNNGIGIVRKALQKLEEIVRIDAENFQPLVEQVQGAYYQLEDAVHQIRDYRDEIEFNPERLNEIEQRLDLLATLRRKYGESVADMLAYKERIQQELARVEHKDERIAELTLHKAKLEEQARALAARLSVARSEAAERLAAAIVVELRDLHMERTQFKVDVRYNDDMFGENGADDVEFLISANPGEPMRPLSKIASGGEISRVMLALKSIFAQVDQIPVLVFDEVDTGVSGRAAQAIAEKMSRLSRHCQVFSITHLPQVACMADVHYLIHKTVDGERTFTRVDHLDLDGRRLELTRMLGGVEVTDKTMQHAQEMLDLADAKKRAMVTG